MTEIVKAPQNESGIVSAFDRITDPLAAASQLGDWITKSGMFGCSKQEEGNLLALACICERKNPIDLLREQHLMFGRIVMKADAMLAKFKTRPGNAWKWQNLGDDGQEASAQVSTSQDSQLISYTLADATRAGLVDKKDSNWKKYPGEMLRARLITKAIRLMDPGVIAGIVSTDEAADMHTPAGPGLALTQEPAPQAPAPQQIEKPARPKTIEVAAVTVAKPAEQPAAPTAPVQKPEPTPAPVADPAPAAPTAATQATQAEAQDPNEPTVEQFEWLGKFVQTQGEPAATGYFRSKGWISATQKWAHLNRPMVEMLMAKPQVFANQIKLFATKNPTA